MAQAAPQGAADHDMSQGNADQNAQQQPGRDAAPEGNNNGNREKRSRDRYGRERNRGERGDRGERVPRNDAPADLEQGAASSQAEAPLTAQASPAQAAPAPAAPALPVVAVRQAEPTPSNLMPTAALPVVAAPASTVKPATVPEAVSTSSPRELPRVSTFVLPMDDLNQVAQSSGLQWVNSDAGKIAAVQAAIAAEPKTVHAPRERSAPAVFNEGPLVLVETRRDLSQMPLPLDQ